MEKHFQDIYQKIIYDNNSYSFAAQFAKNIIQKLAHNNVARLFILKLFPR